MGHTRTGNTRYSNYLEDSWPYSDGLSAVKTIGAQLRDLIDSGLADGGWRYSSE